MIQKVPGSIAVLKGKEKTKALSRQARQSASASGKKTNLIMDRFQKNEAGIPEPSGGVYWSVTHKPGFVAGVVSRERVGIDLEKIKEISTGVFERIVDPQELILFGDQDRELVFFRTFTAKEAVLKKTTEGMKGLSNVKVIAVPDDQNLTLRYSNEKYRVENFFFDCYVASITKNDFLVKWCME